MSRTGKRRIARVRSALLLAGALAIGACEKADPDRTARPDREAGQQAAAKPAQQSRRVPLKGPPSEAGLADALISPDNLGRNLSIEDVMGGPTTLEVCSGDRLRIGNVTDKVIGLEAALYETDISFTLGVLRPGEILAVPMEELGDYLVSAAGEKGYLFHFRVVECPDAVSRKANPAAAR